MSTSRLMAILAVLCLPMGVYAVFSDERPTPQQREAARKQLGAGNFKDAYGGFRKLALDLKDDPKLVGQDLQMATQCLQQLGRVDEVDEFREQVIQVHAGNWRLLAAAAENYLTVEHHGYMVAGKFHRGYKRGGGKAVNAFARDRGRALQLMVDALPKARDDDDRRAVSDFYLALARVLMSSGQYGPYSEAWRLQYLSDLKELPDYEDGWYYGGNVGAPVGEDGTPIYHHVPKRFEDAASDGQRWRWALAQAAEVDPQRTNEVRWQLAHFFQSQFGEQSMAQHGIFVRGYADGDADEQKKDESGPYALETLGEDETIARLATGIKRFKLPDEFNYIKVYQQIASDPKTGYGAESLEALAQIFENRRQYPKAAEYWQKCIKQFGPGNEQYREKRLQQIVGLWGTFEPIMTQPAGQGATVEFRFRNGTKVQFEAHAVRVEKLLDDVKAYLKSNPGQLDYQKMDIANIGYRLVERNEQQYIAEKVASWELELQPRPNHFDKRITVTTPLQKAGAYLLVAKMGDGNTSRIIIWLADTVIAKKPLDGKTHYFVADSVTGQPIAKANLEFFGWRQKQVAPQKYQVETTNYAEFTSADGQVITTNQPRSEELQWLVTARKDGRFAHLGFTNVWSGRYYDAEYNQVKVFTITDRPVYRPKQTVKFKFWVRHAKYDQADTSSFADQSFPIEIVNPKGEKILTKSFKTDAYGGFDGEYELPGDATLGVYRIHIPHDRNRQPQVAGGGSFRVEEYKKPEFEVTVEAPTEPVMLGEKITATIRAKYYFGSPVTKARVKYKVMRSSYEERWYPVGDWDWLYGPGYWWFAYDYTWYKGWHEWGCRRPVPWWWGQSNVPPEIVAEREVEVGEDGTVAVEIDTAVAKAIHGDQDHKYQITAEVVDQSRRTIVGAGNVSVARKPFKVFAWVNRGHFRTGDVIRADFAARTLDSKPVQGTGKLELLKITYNQKREPIETPVEKWDLDTNADGRATQQIKAAAAGQYRLSYRLTVAKGMRPANDPSPQPSPPRGEGDEESPRGEKSQELEESPRGEKSRELEKSPVGEKKSPLPSGGEGWGEGVTIEGGYVFTVMGQGFDGAAFRFNNIELVADQREYQPGNKVKLQVNTDRVGSTVLLFVRPANGIYLPPKLLRLKGKSTVEEIEVAQKDMPNFFVEAVTISGGKVYSETREIVVPPEKRVLNVEAAASRESYKPGQKAAVKVKITDVAGKPFVGSTVLAIYDKSVEYISGGSNVPEIKAYFWKWRRQHRPHTESSLDRYFANVLKSGEIPMQSLGVFGRTVADEDQLGLLGDRTYFGRDGARRELAQGAATMRNAAAPGAPPVLDAFARSEMKAAADLDKSEGPGAPPELVQPTVRKQFADTALWVAALTTDKGGTAEVSLDMPENLTTWKVRVWGMGHGTKVGQGDAEVVTRKDLLVRMQAPRFFVQKDEVVLSANVHNYLKNKKTVRVVLELDGNVRVAGNPSPPAPLPQGERGGRLMSPIARSPAATFLSPSPLGGEGWGEGSPGNLTCDQRPGDESARGTTKPLPLAILGDAVQLIEVAANGEARVDWRVKVLKEGEAVVRMKALTDEESDAMEMRFPVYVHGMLKTESWAGAIRPEKDSGKVTVRVPAERRINESRLEVRYSPTLAAAMVDALPYMVDYPYGCTEQTLNRFLPTVVTQKVLLNMGLDLKAIRDKRTNLNAQEIGDDAERAKQWKRFDRNPVFDEDEVRNMVKAGVQRLTEMQLSDGGWGWFSGWGEHSWPHTTALVVHGLEIAQQNDVALVPGVLDRGVAWLKRHQDGEVQKLKNAPTKTKPWKDHADNIDAFVYMVLVDAGVKNQEMLDFLYRDRTKLAVYCKAMFGLALEKQGEREKLDMILQNISQFLVQDDENQTAFLKLPAADHWWYWYGSEFEAQAYYLKLLARTDPKGETTARLVKYLLNNRKHATYWHSTRDTSIAIEALADFLKASGEDKPDLTVEIWMDGKKQKEVRITPAELFTFDNKFVQVGDAVADGEHTIEFKKRGRSPLYFNAYLTNFTLEDPITRAGLEVKVNRKYFKLTPIDKTIKVAGSRGQAVGQKVEKYRRDELVNLATLKSGELVEIELEIDSKNDYEYLMFEDMKAAGFEPVEVRSGYSASGLGAYMELRDERVTFFVRWLARGKHSVAYRMRAEIPGKFAALPTRASAMYAPELRGNSDEIKLQIED